MRTKLKQVSILSKTAPVATVIESKMKPSKPNAAFVAITKMGSVPVGGPSNTPEVACVGWPTFVPTSQKLTIHSYNTAYDRDDAAKNANQWDMLKDPNIDPADLEPVLDNYNSYTVIPHQVVGMFKTEYARAQERFAECETLEEKLEAMEDMRDIALDASAII